MSDITQAEREALVQVGIDAAAEICALWAEKYSSASDAAAVSKKRIEARDFESMSMACRFRELDIKGISAREALAGKAEQ